MTHDVRHESGLSSTSALTKPYCPCTPLVGTGGVPDDLLCASTVMPSKADHIEEATVEWAHCRAKQRQGEGVGALNSLGEDLGGRSGGRNEV